ncbi:uncharacterized protein BX664DRAFT_302324 [Halteromyces radiatus]|uniref:uncharacterized protein n=1 Tax=Halteromyces radiatus TaxID=101107 RepID=UPI002220ADAB|nr:uncharacterized protein BX664DRAFT_302324 [Halteromyces radiatus]KAI8081538.1 hypothetical protein BX664DRAFT_302324 [Halteromyces radiatus]
MSSPIASSPLKKRRRSSSSCDESSNKRPSISQSSSALAPLPPPMLSTNHPASPSSLTPGIAYYPVYTTHTGHFYIASPPLHPSSPSHPTKILPKLPTLPPSPTPYTFYHPYPSSSSSSSDYPITTADQREQARKVSHSAIERRRRERINDKIMQLKKLIPTCADQDNLHKMSILQSAIDYITYLKQVVPATHPTPLPVQRRSMLPKEVEPYTNQFSTRPVSPPLSNDDDDDHHSSLKPSDLLLSTPSSTKNMSLKNILC